MTTIKYGFYLKEMPLEEALVGCVEKGWHPLVTRLVDDLYAAGWDGEVVQIKEKFGGLRFYINKGNDLIFNLIANAEVDSIKTCEYCGKPGKPNGRGWIKTTCDEHVRR